MHRVIKRRANGSQTVYTFYTRFRNTKDAWPSIALPEPLEKEFSERLSICEAMARDEKGYLLDGKRLPDLKSKEFWPEATKAFEAFVRRGRQGVKDFKSLVEAFQSDTNPVWTALAPSTRRGYEASGEIIKEIWGDELPADLTTVDAQEAIDEFGETPAKANQFRAFLSRLTAWGIPRGYCTENVVEHTEKVPGGDPWVPWPNWAFEILFEHAPFHMQMIAMSAFFTGQRQGDVLKMTKPKAGENTVAVTAQKTKNTVWIPIHFAYRKWIDRVPQSDSVMLHAGARAISYKSADSFRTEWQKLMAKEEFKRFREERIVFHGLRKNAVINLLEVGCTENQAGAICNMSAQMVQHYGREVALRSLAKDAMKLMEARWSEIEPAAFRNKNGT
ncbi:tyrosine-type recombinase/integrase [Sinorhizobium meliloti]|nr:tyrosine-type recombinase/integrase [Sinorhizobium meliloti]MDW9630426.1 tyrosine-type recombinase/integrase [Sinorhizobium meliloti]